MLILLILNAFLFCKVFFECSLGFPMGDDAVQFLETPEKSELDNKLYRLFKLSNNGLTVLLISTADDENDDELLAQVALTVKAGSIYDLNSTVPGMAHFVEHMLFLGSEKYPEENGFDKFITSNGGHANAKTDFEQTLYYYFILENSLESSLDRFASLFTSPLLSKDGMTREREAIESEFQGAREGFYTRYEQMLTTLVKPNHPSSSFSWGNLKTLKEDISDDNLQAKTRDFFNTHYVANQMFLCIQSNAGLDDLQSMVVKYYSDIPSHDVGPPLVKNPQYAWDNTVKSDFFDKIYYVKSNSEQHKLVLTWVMPPSGEYKSKSNEYLSFVLGDESSGSLTSYLKNQLLATSVQAELSHGNFKWSSLYTFHTMYITLTDLGYEKIDSVLEAVFSYLLFLQTEGPSEDFYNDVKQIKYNEFRFNTISEYNAAENVVDMINYSPKDILKGSKLFFSYNKDKLDRIYSLLNEGKFNVMIFSNQGEFDKVEKWMNIDYREEDFPEKFKQLWVNRKPKNEFYYPKPNEFISSNFDIVYSKTGEHKTSTFPVIIYENDCSKSWYRLDTKFLLPKAAIYVYLQSPIVVESKFNLALLNLFSLLFQHQINDDLYAAKQAEYEIDFDVKPKGIVVKILGNNQKIGNVLEVITRNMAKMEHDFDESAFQTYKKELKNNCYEKISDVEDFNVEIRNEIIETNKPGNLDIYLEVDKLTIEDMKRFVRKYLDTVNFQILIQGNMLESDAVNIIQNIMSGHSCKNEKQRSPAALRSRKLPQEKNIVRVKTLSENSNNSAVSNYYQLGENSIQLQSSLELLLAILKEPMFNILRTQEQLGYVVSAKFRNNNNVLGFTITVLSQENKNSADVVYERIENFLKNKFNEYFMAMEEKDFNSAKQSLIQKKTNADIVLEDEVDRNWKEVVNGEHMFDRKFKIIDEMRKISKNELYTFYKTRIQTSEALLSIQVIGDNHHHSSDNKVQIDVLPAPEKNQVDNFKYITSVQSFRNSLETFPELKTKL